MKDRKKEKTSNSLIQLPDGDKEWEDPVIWNRMHCGAMSWELALEDDTDLKRTEYAMNETAELWGSRKNMLNI